MPLVYPNMQLSEVVEEHPSLIPVINRFGIRLGLGDKSVKTLCEEHSLDTDFFFSDQYLPQRGVFSGEEVTNFPYIADH